MWRSLRSAWLAWVTLFIVVVSAVVSPCAFAAGEMAESVCLRTKQHCLGPGCLERVACRNGFCDASGACQCLPCFSGPTCAAYEDKYPPRFATSENTVIIDARHQGVLYQAVAEDDDLGLSCPLGPGRNTRCPCATVHYRLDHLDARAAFGTSGEGEEAFARDRDMFATRPDMFWIHETSGQVFVGRGVVIRPGEQYAVRILASNPTGVEGHTAEQQLKVVVRSKVHLEDLLEIQDDSSPPGPT